MRRVTRRSSLFFGFYLSPSMPAESDSSSDEWHSTEMIMVREPTLKDPLLRHDFMPPSTSHGSQTSVRESVSPAACVYTVIAPCADVVD